jgi:glycosyltransferase involved in cell wall biosynthesis
MDLIYVVNQFPKLSESFVINEIHELARRGHNICVFAHHDPEEDLQHAELEELDISVYYASSPSYRSAFDFFSARILNSDVLRQAAFFDDPLHHVYWLHLGTQLSRVIDRLDDIDLIHAHFASANRVAVAYAAAYHGLPCTVTAHANELFSDPDIRRVRRVCSRFDHVVVPSEYNKQYLRTQIGVNTKMSIVPATTNVDKFEPAEECVPGRLLTVARLIEKKGHKYAIDAIANLVAQGYNIKYHIVGTGELERSLRRRIQARDIEKHVEFLGHISDEELQTELQEAELFVLPCIIASDGDRDVAPVALKEAMATRTACISTSISAIPELITNGEDGLLVSPEDTDALTDAISNLLDNTKKRNLVAANGRRTVKTEFDISHSVDKLEQVFRRIKK